MTVDEADATRILVVRHGESVATTRRMLAGVDACEGLSALGSEQAARLRDRFRQGHEPAIDVVVSSDIARALETATIVNDALGLDIEIDAEFQEHRPGDAEGMTFPEYVERWGMPDQLAEPYKQLAPNGESRADFFLRVGTAFDSLANRHRGKSIAVFCHGGVVDVAVRTLLALGHNTPFILSTLNTSITEFALVQSGPPRQWQMVRYNDAAHLAGLPAATVPSER